MELLDLLIDVYIGGGKDGGGGGNTVGNEGKGFNVEGLDEEDLDGGEVTFCLRGTYFGNGGNSV